MIKKQFTLDRSNNFYYNKKRDLCRIYFTLFEVLQKNLSR